MALGSGSRQLARQTILASLMATAHNRADRAVQSVGGQERTRPHHWIQTLYQQRSASDTTSLYKSTTIHDSFPIDHSNLPDQTLREPIRLRCPLLVYNPSGSGLSSMMTISSRVDTLSLQHKPHRGQSEAHENIPCSHHSTSDRHWISSRHICTTPPRYDLLLKGGHVIDPANHIDDVRDVAVFQGKIAAVERDIPADRAGKVVDVSKLLVTPGLIDIHYHVGHGGAPLDWFTPEARAHALPLGIPADMALQSA